MCDRVEQVAGNRQPGRLREKPEDEAKAPERIPTPAGKR